MALLDAVLQVKANLAPLEAVPSVTASPGWQVVGSVFTRDTTRAQLEANVALSHSSRLLRIRIVEAATLTPLPAGILATTSVQTMTRIVSKVFDLKAATLYQIQAECTGGTGEADFAMVYGLKISESVN